ncbi:MAG: SGNH/GDSL hydrolase family protein [Candidatus Omnitrophica bacterium]|nr:SGNH/GDSL hydrolase family protein [Candidatus Omnitrophota bacterium]
MKGIYCRGCKVAASRELANAEILHKLADSLKIEYFDMTPALRAASKKLFLHVKNLHFNDEGHRIYSEEITKILKNLTVN